MPTGAVASSGPLTPNLSLSALSTASPRAFCLPKNEYVCTKTTPSDSSPVSSAKRPPEMPQCETIGTSQPTLAFDFTTWAPSGALATSMTTSAPPCLRRSSCGLMSGSFQLNFSTPTALTPRSANHLVRPVSLDWPQAVFSSSKPGLPRLRCSAA